MAARKKRTTKRKTTRKRKTSRKRKPSCRKVGAKTASSAGRTLACRRWK